MPFLKQICILGLIGFLFLVVPEILAQPYNPSRKGPPPGMQPKSVSPSAVGYIETHMHLSGIYGKGQNKERDFDTAAQNAIARMKQLNIKKMFIMPPPTRYNKDASTWYDYEELKEIAQKYPNRFSFLGGGGVVAGFL